MFLRQPHYSPALPIIPERSKKKVFRRTGAAPVFHLAARPRLAAPEPESVRETRTQAGNPEKLHVFSAISTMNYVFSTAVLLVQSWKIALLIC
jgi:hypothetical protein